MNKFHESLKKYLELYMNQETYFTGDTRNLEFFKAYPLNTRLEDIHQKLSLMDDADFNKLGAHGPMAEHILKLKIDPRLSKGDLSLVEDIAKVTIDGKQQHLLHVASTYCNLHHPDVFPVYTEEHFKFYKRYIGEYKLTLNPDELNHYDVFTKALEDLITRYGIKGKLNYLQMRKFAWVYAEKIMEDADPLTKS